MLPKINKLKKERDFGELFKKGRSFKNNFLILKIIQNNSQENHFGFIISKKVSKKAVVRNKIRRRVYSAVHNLMPELSDNLFLLIAKAGSENIKGQDLKDELVELLKKV